jgi:glycine/sarcosine N-methyltransferase
VVHFSEVRGWNVTEKVPLYDDFSESYDVMVDWQERLDREEPFFRRLFQLNNAHRVLDVGCATGGHVFRFAKMGLDAVGVDPSLEMIKLAEEQARGKQDVRFVQAGFGELRERLVETFDAITCLGNTIPHALTRADLDRALADMAAVLRPGGLLAIQQLNYDRILREKRRFLGVSSGMRDGIEHLFFRFYDYDGSTLAFNVITFKKVGGKWDFRAGSTQLHAITQKEMAESLDSAGFELAGCFGSYSEEPFDRESSGDLVVVAKRA